MLLSALLLACPALASCLPLTIALSSPLCQQDPVVEQADGQEGSSPESVLAAQGVLLDRAHGLIELAATICQDEEPLEYLIIKPNGKDHESLFRLDERVSAAGLNTAMLLLGVEQGRNGKLVAKDPLPSREEYEAGTSLYNVEHATGDGFYIYAGWEQQFLDGHREQWFYRAEDLVINSRRIDTYKRGKFVYLGSRFIKPHQDSKELFAAEADGNLVSLVYFNPANHLLTGADPEANDQYVWYPNTWLLPAIGTPVTLWLSREPLSGWPE